MQRKFEPNIQIEKNQDMIDIINKENQGTFADKIEEVKRMVQKVQSEPKLTTLPSLQRNQSQNQHLIQKTVSLDATQVKFNVNRPAHRSSIKNQTQNSSKWEQSKQESDDVLDETPDKKFIMGVDKFEVYSPSQKFPVSPRFPTTKIEKILNRMALNPQTTPKDRWILRNNVHNVQQWEHWYTEQFHNTRLQKLKVVEKNKELIKSKSHQRFVTTQKNIERIMSVDRFQIARKALIKEQFEQVAALTMQMAIKKKFIKQYNVIMEKRDNNVIHEKPYFEQAIKYSYNVLKNRLFNKKLQSQGISQSNMQQQGLIIKNAIKRKIQQTKKLTYLMLSKTQKYIGEKIQAQSLIKTNKFIQKCEDYEKYLEYKVVYNDQQKPLNKLKEQIRKYQLEGDIKSIKSVYRDYSILKSNEQNIKMRSLLKHKMRTLGSSISLNPDVLAFLKKKFFYGTLITDLNRNKKLNEQFKVFEEFIICELSRRLIQHLRFKYGKKQQDKFCLALNTFCTEQKNIIKDSHHMVIVSLGANIYQGRIQYIQEKSQNFSQIYQDVEDPVSALINYYQDTKISKQPFFGYLKKYLFRRNECPKVPSFYKLLESKFNNRTCNLIVELLVQQVCKKLKFDLAYRTPTLNKHTEQARIKIEIKNMFDSLQNNQFNIDTDNEETSLREFFNTVDGISEEHVYDMFKEIDQ